MERRPGREDRFTASGLTAGATHTLVITVTGEFTAPSGGAFVVVDAFDVTGSTTGSTVTRLEEMNPAVSFAGTGWTLRDSQIATFSGGAAATSNIPGDASNLTFTGTAVSWIGLRCNVCGIATVSIDGGAPVTVDTAGPGEPGSGLSSEAVFSASGLDPAVDHTLVITVTGTTTSGDTHIAIDAFDVTP